MIQRTSAALKKDTMQPSNDDKAILGKNKKRPQSAPDHTVQRMGISLLNGKPSPVLPHNIEVLQRRPTLAAPIPAPKKPRTDGFKPRQSTRLADISSVLDMPDIGFDYSQESKSDVQAPPSPPPLFPNQGLTDDELTDLFAPPNLDALREDLHLSDSDSDEDLAQPGPSNQDNKPNLKEEWYNALSLIQTSTKELVHMDSNLITKDKLVKLADVTSLLVNVTIAKSIE